MFASFNPLQVCPLVSCPDNFPHCAEKDKEQRIELLQCKKLIPSGPSNKKIQHDYGTNIVAEESHDDAVTAASMEIRQ